MSSEAKIVQTADVILAIVGYRYYSEYTEFSKSVDEYIAEVGSTPKEIHSGGCRGVDTMGERYAKEHSIKMVVWKPNWDKYQGVAAFTARDKQIAEHCTHMIAFPSKKGKGTQITIKFAQQFKKQVKVIFVD
jgi:hypothetical protein